MKLKIFFFLEFEVGLSVTITNDGLFDEALMRPHEPSSKENQTPFKVKSSSVLCLSLFVLFFFRSAIFFHFQ